jgi:hypothetical protein
MDLGELLAQIDNNLSTDRWKTQDGRVIPIREMDDKHLANTIRYLGRRGYAAHAAVEAGSTDLIDITEAKMCVVNPVTVLRYKNMVEEAGRRGGLGLLTGTPRRGPAGGVDWHLRRLEGGARP